MSRYREGFVSRRELKILFFKWEFLRRNKHYQKDFKHISKVLKVSDTMIQDGENTRKAQRILEKWDILTPINPSLTVLDLLESDQKKDTWYIGAVLAGGQAMQDQYLIYKMSDKEVLHKASNAEINLNMYCPKERIMAELEAEVDKWKARIRLAMNNEGWGKNEKRMKFESYEQYLKVYDLRMKGLTWDVLAKKIYPNDAERDRNYAKKKVKLDFLRCMKFIEGDYRQIS